MTSSIAKTFSEANAAIAATNLIDALPEILENNKHTRPSSSQTMEPQPSPPPQKRAKVSIEDANTVLAEDACRALTVVGEGLTTARSKEIVKQFLKMRCTSLCFESTVFAMGVEDFKGNPGPSAFTPISEAISKSETLEQLTFHRCFFAKRDIFHLVLSLQESRSRIHHLNLSGCNICADIVTIGYYIKKCSSSLQHLDLSDNHGLFGSPGSKTMGKFMNLLEERKSPLGHLDVSNAALGERQGGEICSHLASNTNLGSLDISFNPRGFARPSDIFSLLSLISKNTTLSQLRVSGCCLGKLFWSMFAEAMEENSTLEHLEILEDDIPDDWDHPHEIPNSELRKIIDKVKEQRRESDGEDDQLRSLTICVGLGPSSTPETTQSKS